MTKSDPNAGGSVVTYIFELGLKGDPETCKNFIKESGIYTHGCNDKSPAAKPKQPSLDLVPTLGLVLRTVVAKD